MMNGSRKKKLIKIPNIPSMDSMDKSRATSTLNMKHFKIE